MRGGGFLHDAHWQAAFALGPLFWLVLACWRKPAFDPLWPAHAPLWFVSVVFLYPVLEEVAFRGALQGSLRQGLGTLGPWPGLSLANILTSIVFVLLHLLYHPPLWALAVLIPSLLFGYFRDRFDGAPDALLAPIALHAWYNAGWFWLFETGGMVRGYTHMAA